jgi:BirA family transcriptional regulator, biotin operon repressor / biotin---[acetyl-CoA-carboxylase] ligase
MDEEKIKNFPWLHYLESCTSTNTWTLDRLNTSAKMSLYDPQKQNELKHGDVIFTRRQTAGRGQRGRSWYSNKGVLTASFYLDCLPTLHLSYLSLLTGLAIIYAVEDLAIAVKNELRLKWTNDIMLAEGKLAGILCEAIARGKESRVVVGVGINLCVNFTEVNRSDFSIANPVSLHQFTTAPEDLVLLEKIRHYLLELSSSIVSEKFTLAAFLPELNRRNFLLDRQVKFQSNESEYTGIVTGIDDRGGLSIAFSDNSWRSFQSGRVLSWC